MKKTLYSLATFGVLLAGCTAGSLPGQTTTSPTTNPSTSLIVQGLTPICASTLRDRNIIPQQARNFGITEETVCECGLRKAETELVTNPALLLEILRSTDAQINLLVRVGGQCSAELLQRAVTGQPIPTPTPSTYWPPTPGSTPVPNPAPTFWPPAG